MNIFSVVLNETDDFIVAVLVMTGQDRRVGQ